MADGKIIIDTKVDNSGAESDIKSLGGKIGSMAGSTLGTVTKVTGAMVVAASGAVAALATLSIKQYAEYEQLVGGVETLFKDSSDIVKRYADNAFRTAGLSANEYMSTITGFSASLLQGLGGDTEKAAKVGNQAVVDMSDNANKMGTSMESIQNAYSGFAKQNYTMLDNLKLGYSGTKTEMERLLKDAEKLSGQKYDIGNFSDVIEGIHVIQSELGITGTTAKEASTTISGSLNMTKSAWSNLLRGISDDSANFDDLINDLVFSVTTFGDNILPRVKIALDGIGKLVAGLASELPKIILEILPGVIDSGIQVIGALGKGIMDSLPQILDMGVQIIGELLDGVQQSLPFIIQGAFTMLMTLINQMISMLPQILQMGIDIIVQLALGLAETLPELIPIAIDTILTLYETLLDNYDKIVDAGIKLIIALADGLINALPKIIDKIPIIIEKLLSAFTTNFPKLVQKGIELIFQLQVGLIKAIPSLLTAIPKIIWSVIKAFGDYYRNFADVGVNIVKGMWNGIVSMGSWIAGKVSGFFSNIVEGAKSALKIHSPSRVFRDEVGKYMAQGVGVGFEDETDNVKKSMNADFKNLVAKMKGTVDYETTMTTARIVTHTNSLSGVTQEDNKNNESNKPKSVQAIFNIDGREFMRATAPYQDEFETYYEGR